MNKRPKDSQFSRSDELENDLAEIHDSNEVAENENEPVKAPVWDITANNRQRELFIKQGTRMRHPDKVLHQFKNIVGDQGAGTKSKFLQAFKQETERTEVPGMYTFRPGNEGMTVTQLGVAKAAHQNYTKASNPDQQKMNKVYAFGF